MKLKLKSNFWEPWHSAFDSDGQEFRLVTTDGPNRIEQHKIFKKARIPTPLFGHYDFFLKNNYNPERFVIAYDDINAHCGEGKTLVKFGDLKEKEDRCLCEYVHSGTHFSDFNKNPQFWKSISTRYLFIGDYTYEYYYMSSDDWRSNCGEGDISEPKMIYTPSWRNKICYPFFAIDWVGLNTNLKAIDLNIAPGTYGIKLPLSSTQMVLSIKTWLQKYANNTES